jgi:hypothetical protein
MPTVRSPCTLLWPRSGDPRARTPEIAAQQKQVGNRLDVLGAVLVLGDAHAIADDDVFGRGIDLRHALDRLAREARGGLDPVPRGRLDIGLEAREPFGVPGDEIMVEHVPARVFQREDGLHHPLEHGQIAADPHLMIGRGQRGGMGREHLGHVLGRLEPFEPALAHRVGHDDRRAALGGRRQRGEHARMVGARIVTDAEDRIGIVEVFERDSALADADRDRQARAGRLVAHVRAVGEIVGAKGAGEQLVKERRLVRGAARAIEFGHVGLGQGLHHRARAGKGLFPTDRHEMVGLRIIAQRGGQSPGILKLVIAPRPQFGGRMAGKEIGIDALDRGLPRHGLGAVFAELERGGMLGIGPGAAGAIEPVGLVHLEQRAGIGAGLHLRAHGPRHRAQRPQPPAGPL